MPQIQVKLEGHLYRYASPWTKMISWSFHTFDASDKNTIKVMPLVVEAVVETEDEEFVAARVEALRAAKQAVLAQAASDAKEIDDQLEKLLALTNTVEG